MADDDEHPGIGAAPVSSERWARLSPARELQRRESGRTLPARGSSTASGVRRDAEQKGTGGRYGSRLTCRPESV